jgi:hypothetical protein
MGWLNLGRLGDKKYPLIVYPAIADKVHLETTSSEKILTIIYNNPWTLEIFINLNLTLPSFPIFFGGN